MTNPYDPVLLDNVQFDRWLENRLNAGMSLGAALELIHHRNARVRPATSQHWTPPHLMRKATRAMPDPVT